MVNLLGQMASNLAAGFQAMKTGFSERLQIPLVVSISRLLKELGVSLCDPEAIPTQQSKV